MKHVFGAAMMAAALIASSAHAAAPQGWSLNGPAARDFDSGTEASTRVAGGRDAFVKARMESSGFATLSQGIDAGDYRGKRVRFSAYLRTEDASKAMLWLRVDDGAHKAVTMDNMEDRPVRGTVAWQPYALVQDVPDNAESVVFGVLLENKGEVWISAPRLEVVGKDVPLTRNVLQKPRAPVNMDFSR